ncbi:acyl-CoA thioesterase [Fundidesulfovibrio putealis]|uniref:acyl-CoA thioesterase n=1 Tax=Fundidesulfovibrio putealis TaxID=270496 RepID=UPI0004126342|nr:thioesterase family protein [Fundidesulfovibrio putealis]
MIRPGEPFPEADTRFELYVSYGETDAMGVVYYGNYAHWFERSRGQYLRERGLSYAEVERRGVMLPVREMAVRYISPARYDEHVVVRAGISQWGRASVTFAYQVFGPPEHSRLVCLGTTQHACVDANGKPVAVPGWLKEICLK